MNSQSLKSIETFLAKKYIYLNKQWIQQNIDNLTRLNNNLNSSTLEESIYQEFLKTNLKEAIDLQKVINLKDKINKDIKHSIIQGYYLFQIEDFINIAESFYKVNQNSNNLDVVDEEVETVYLKNEDEKVKKVYEKKIFKLKLTQGLNEETNNYIYGFEYKPIRNIDKYIENKYQKILIGPTFQARIGFIYLTNENIKFM